MKRENAMLILKDWVKSPSLLRHCLAVEQVMRCAALQYGGADANPDIWGIAGLLHDADWEAFPDEHPNRIVEHLRSIGEEEIAYAISAHGTAFGIPAITAMDRALLASDEMTGFVVACALLRPNGIHSLEVESVLKKLKNLKFASGVDREEIAAGVQFLNVDIADHIAFIISALRQKSDELGLSLH